MPIAARLTISRVPVRSPTMFGNSALRDTVRSPRACLTIAVRLIAPKLYSRPRSIASLKESVPENARFVAPRTLPMNAPCTATVGLSVLTLVVVPGTGASVATTVPTCVERPDSGTGIGCALDVAGAVICAAVLTAITWTRRIVAAGMRQDFEAGCVMARGVPPSAQLPSKAPDAHRHEHDRE